MAGPCTGGEAVPPMVDCCGRGVGDDGEAERPPLVFAMAEMKRGGCSGFQRRLNLCVGETVEFLGFWTSRVYIGMRFKGF